MAVVLDNVQSTYGNPYAYYTVTLTASNRTSSTVDVTCNVSARLASSSSYTAYGVICYLYIGGSWSYGIPVGTGGSWSGTTPVTGSRTITVTGLSSSQTSLTDIMFKAVSNAQYDGAGLDEIYCNDLYVGASSDSGGSSGGTQRYLRVYYNTSHISLTVKRNGSNASHGDPIYDGDTLQVVYSAKTGCESAWLDLNGRRLSSGDTWNVNGGVEINAGASVKSYILSLSEGTGSKITVNRASSPLQGASSGTLSNGSTIYYNDVLSISFVANTGYNISTCKINGNNSSGGNVTVTNSVSASSSATVKSFTLSIIAGAGSVVSINRTSSSLKGATTGTISNGATIYYNDVLKISFTPSGAEYEITTHTVNGSVFNSGNSHTVTNDVAIVSTAKLACAVYIYNGIDYDKYLTYIYNGSTWEQYIPYVYDGSNWIICS